MAVMEKILTKLAFILTVACLLASLSMPVYAQSVGDINSILNGTTWYDPDSAGDGSCTGGVTNLIGTDNVQKAMNYLIGQGLSSDQAAGVIGNLEQESGQGLNPLAQQNGSDSATPIAGVGFGIAQWTDAPRQQNLVKYASDQGGQPGDLSIQLGFLWQELTSSYANVLQNLKASTSVDDAVNQFVGPKNLAGQPVSPTAEVQRTGGYENPGKPNMKNRLDYAHQVASTYSGDSTGGTSSCVTGSANCTPSTQQTGASAALSDLRQTVICLTENELAFWKSQPGYPHPDFSQSGYYKYSQNRQEEWCADFVSWIYEKAGYPLQPDPTWNVSYVPNIQSIGQQNTQFHWHPQGSNYKPKPGDLAIHGSNHVNIFISSIGGTSQYIGGDQGSGPYPGGSIVSVETGSGYYDNGITGYVSPE
jgi:hypothetical protein